MANAKRTDPELWEKVKAEVTRGAKGGRPGEWSARKAQMAVQAYKRRGGGYAADGPKQKDTDLAAWTREDWGTKSGGKSGDTGERYLPRKVRMVLTEAEYARSTARKRRDTHGKGRQVAPQPRDVAEKAGRIKAEGPTRAMLDTRARELGITGRSKLSKDELLREIDRATDREGRAKDATDFASRTKADLYRIAQERGIEGRSSMSRDELLRALKG
jgi:hypothetical protein